MTENEAKLIFEEIKELDDTMYAYSEVYMNALDVAINALEEVQQYRKLGTVEEVRESVENTKPKKPKKNKTKYCYDYYCAKCGHRFISKDDSGWYCGKFEKFCSDCGTPVDWSGELLEGEELSELLGYK